MSGPNVWGPHGWKFIHYITLGYPMKPTEIHKKQYLDFFNALQYVIPCSICGHHFREHVKIYPLTDSILSDRMEFIKWGIHMHNLVNFANKKKVYTMQEGYDEILKNKDDCVVKTDTMTHNSKNTLNKIDNMQNTILLNALFLIIGLIIIYISLKIMGYSITKLKDINK